MVLGEEGGRMCPSLCCVGGGVCLGVGWSILWRSQCTGRWSHGGGSATPGSRGNMSSLLGIELESFKLVL